MKCNILLRSDFIREEGWRSLYLCKDLPLPPGFTRSLWLVELGYKQVSEYCTFSSNGVKTKVFFLFCYLNSAIFVCDSRESDATFQKMPQGCLEGHKQSKTSCWSRGRLQLNSSRETPTSAKTRAGPTWTTGQQMSNTGPRRIAAHWLMS